jgi:hypothetical protein
MFLVIGDELPQAVVGALDLVEGAKTTSPVLWYVGFIEKELLPVLPAARMG